MNHELIYCIVKILHLCWVIVYRQFHNYDGVIFLYYHISDSNYRLPIDTEIFFWIYPFSMDRILPTVFHFWFFRFRYRPNKNLYKQK
jgi:hypothetical protein